MNSTPRTVSAKTKNNQSTKRTIMSNPEAVSVKTTDMDSRTMILSEDDISTLPDAEGEKQSIQRSQMRVPTEELYAVLTRRVNQYTNKNDMKQSPRVPRVKDEVLNSQWQLPQSVPIKMAHHVKRGQHSGQGSLEDNNTDDIDQNIKIIDLTKESEDEDCETYLARGKNAYDESGK